MNRRPPDPVPASLPLSRSSLAWRVNGESAVFGGGGRALLLQVAHPGVGAGVEQHSSYATDPWGRFLRTVDVMMKLSFGTPEVSGRQQRMLDKMHRRVAGTTDDGTPYSANDPELQLWVWATLVDTALLVYERVRPALGRAAREQYYQESKLVAHGCGVPVGSCPGTWEDFTAYVASVVDADLRVTDSARAVALAALHPPLPGPLGSIAAVPNRLATVGLLPPTLRDQYGFAWSGAQQRQLDAWFVAQRSLTSLTPRVLRTFPAARAVAQTRPPRLTWLRRRGAQLTERRLADAGWSP